MGSKPFRVYPMSRLGWFSHGLAIAVLFIVLVPWPTFSPEVSIEEFDPLLITIEQTGSPDGGQASVSPREIVLSEKPHSRPTVHLLTSEVPFTAAFSVSVRDWNLTFPLRIKVWNPRAGAAAEA